MGCRVWFLNRALGPILRCGKLSFVFHATAQYLFNVELFVGRDVESLRDNAERGIVDKSEKTMHKSVENLTKRLKHNVDEQRKRIRSSFHCCQKDPKR